MYKKKNCKHNLGKYEYFERLVAACNTLAC